MKRLRAVILLILAFLASALSASAAVVTATYNSATDVPVTAAAYTATGNSVNFTLNYAPEIGAELTVIKNTGLPFITGQFSNLTQRQTVTLNYSGVNYNFVANYNGGTGNDLVLVWKNSRTLAWGNNNSGQLGNTSTTNSSVPLAVMATGLLSGKTVLTVSAGVGHTVALCSDGTVATWGDNYYGQLGSNSYNSSSRVPVLVRATGVLSDKTVVAVSAGANHSLALCSDGTVVAWGQNVYGQLGDNSRTYSSGDPVAVTTTGVLLDKTVVAVSAGADYSLALCSDGTVAAWGYNVYGQLGNSGTTVSTVPVAVTTTGVLSDKTVVAVFAGANHSLALCSDGTVAAWGSNGYGQLGNNSRTSTSSNVPVAVSATGVLSGKTVIALSAGENHTVALCSDGTIAAWGNNSSGQLGNSGATVSTVPVAVTATGVLAGKTVVAVSAGTNHSLALCSDGTVAAWGGNLIGELGNNSTTQSSEPVSVSTSGLIVGERFTKTFTGSKANHTLALVAAPPLAPTIITPTSANVTTSSASLGGNVTSEGDATITERGVVYAATATNNNPSFGGTGTTKVIASGVTGVFTASVTGLSGGTAYSFKAYASNILGITSYTNVGTFGTALQSITANYTSEIDVPVTLPGVTIVSGSTATLTLSYAPVVGTELTVVKNTGVGFINGVFSNLIQGQTVTLSYGGVNYNFVVNYYGGTGNDLVLVWKNNRLLSWGKNSDGQLGNNNTTDSSVSVAVSATGVLSGKTVVAVSAGNQHSLALCSDGTVAAWGDNGHGKLGNNSMIHSRVPVAVSMTGALFGKTVVAVSAGYQHSMALCSDGTVAAWGDNNYGQLGNNSANRNVYEPVIVTATGALSGKSVVAVSAGWNHTVALCSDGTMAAWGSNSTGQLGNDSTTDSRAPAAVNANGVLSGKFVVAISAGNGYSMALCSDGTVAAWGANYSGQLGNNSTTNSSSPVLVMASGVLSGKTVVAVSVGLQYGSALCSDGTVAAWGYNNVGQLGNGSRTNTRAPEGVPMTGVLSGKTVVAVSAGGAHSAARCSDGTVVTWGDNYVGQLGNYSATYSTVPVAVSTSALLAGERFTTTITGSSAYHNLALVAAPLVAPTVITPSIASVAASTASLGGNVTNEGDGSITERGIVYSKTATNSNPSIGGTGVTKVSLGGTIGVFTISVAGLSEGTGYSFRAYASSAVGTSYSSVGTFGTVLGNLATRYTAVTDVPTTLPSVTIVSGSMAALTLDYAPVVGTELMVIKNTGVGFINGVFSNLTQGQTVTLSYGGVNYNFVVNYYGGTGNDLVLVWKNNRLLSWGKNSDGQLGNNNTTDSSVSVAVSASGVLSGKTVVAVSAGNQHSLALCSDGTVAACGDNYYGQLGNNSTIDSSVPVAVTATGALSGKTVVAVSAGYQHSVALCSDGTVVNWGSNISGQLSYDTNGQLGKYLSSTSVPLEVPKIGVLSSKTVVAVSAGFNHSLALCSDGTVVSLGRNAPEEVTGIGLLSGKTVVAVSAAAGHNLALCSDGTVAAWGNNNFGQLGNGTKISSGVPVAVKADGVLSGKTVVAVSAGGSHSVALCSDGTIAVWGYGYYRPWDYHFSVIEPEAVRATGVLSGKAAVAVSSGVIHNLALCSDGTVAAWGDNFFGQLGNNSTTSVGRDEQVAVSTGALLSGERFTQVISGQSAFHTLALVAAPPWVVMQLAGNSLPIANADSTPATEDGTDFGSLAMHNSQTTRNFTISNLGGAQLRLTGPNSIQISGDAAADFKVTTQPESLITESTSTAFAITFDPRFPGLRQATVTITNNSREASPYTFAISGFGVLTVKRSQTISFSPPTTAYINQSPIFLTATASSGLPVTFTMVSGPATLVGNRLNLFYADTVKVIASQPGGSNFAAASSVTKYIVVTAVPTALTLINLAQTYDGTSKPISTIGGSNPVISYRIGGVYGSTAPTKAGSYPVKAVDGAVTKTGTLVIAKASLTVTPDDQRKFVGQPTPMLTYDIRGLQGTDTSAVLTKAPVLATSSTANSVGGVYPITASAGSALNYTFKYQQGSMVVESFAGTYEALLIDSTPLPIAKLTITVPTSSKTFTAKACAGAHTPAVSFTGDLICDPELETTRGSATTNIFVNKVKIPYVVNFTLPLIGDFFASVTRDSVPLGSSKDGRKLLIAPGKIVNYAGMHTVVLEPATPAEPTVPVGAGWATASINKSGVMTLAGKLGDGTAFTSALSPDNQENPVYRLFAQPYVTSRSESSSALTFPISSIEQEKPHDRPIVQPALTVRTDSYLAGAFTLTVHPNLRRELSLINRRYVKQAGLTWKKTGRPADTTYRAGFGPVNTLFMLDPWLPPAPANTKFNTYAITLADRLGLISDYDNVGTFSIKHSQTGSVADASLPTQLHSSAKNVVTVYTPWGNSTQWKTSTFNLTAGTFTGSFVLSDVVANKTIKRPVTFSGVLRQPALSSDVLIGDGHYLLPPLTGTEKSTGEIMFTRP